MVQISPALFDPICMRVVHSSLLAQILSSSFSADFLGVPRFSCTFFHMKIASKNNGEICGTAIAFLRGEYKMKNRPDAERFIQATSNKKSVRTVSKLMRRSKACAELLNTLTERMTNLPAKKMETIAAFVRSAKMIRLAFIRALLSGRCCNAKSLPLMASSR